MPGGNTITINPPNDLAPGDAEYIDFRSFKGDLPKEGWLVKRGPFSGVVIDSYVSFRLVGSADGMSSPVPAETARTLDSNTVSQFVQVQNPSSNSNTAPKEDVEIILFGQDPDQEDDSLRFDPRKAIEDIVPGVTGSGLR